MGRRSRRRSKHPGPGGQRHVLRLERRVDSSVTAVLIHRALGDQLTCVFVNNGLLRKGEPELVQRVFRDNFHIDLRYANAEDWFLAALAGVTEPEQKRKIIGNLFIEVFEEEARAIGDVEILAQGTLYPDVIESVSATGGPSVTIKSHHNVGGLPDKMHLELLEPLRELFKDEVRALGRELGLPRDRRPPPFGPGLGVRCVGAVTRERLDTLREADAIFIEEIKRAGLYPTSGRPWCACSPSGVGVQGDERSYEEVCSLRAVTSEDAMTADWFRFPPRCCSAWPTGSATRCGTSTACSTTSPRSRPAPSSGSDPPDVPQLHSIVSRWRRSAAVRNFFTMSDCFNPQQIALTSGRCDAYHFAPPSAS